MTKNSFSAKTFILTILLVLSFIFMQNAWFLAGFNSQQKSNVSADSSGKVSVVDVTSKLTNNTFDSTSGTSFPRTPSGWSVWDSNTTVAPEASGVIDLTPSIYKDHYIEDYKLGDFTDQPPQRQGATEQYVLMINSGNNGSKTASLNYGYASSSDFELDPNSFYSIQAYVYTSTDAHASIYLTGDDVENLSSSAITGINTNGWQQVVIYIATGSEKTINVGLELFIGEKGAESGSIGFVLFDNITITRHSGDNFDASSNSGYFKTLVDLRPSYVTLGDGFVENGDFTSPLTNGWTQEASKNAQSVYIANLNNQLNINGTNVIIGDNQRGNKQGAIISADSGYNSIKSNDIEIKQSGLYKITFWAKGEISTGNINFTIDGNLPDETVLEETPVSATISTLATDAIELNNNWALYTLYVVGNPLFDSTVNLHLGIGSDTADATGYIAVTGIKTEKVTSAHKENSTANSATLQMYEASSLTFTNGTFNFINVTEADGNYPYEPQSWTKLNENATGQSGVVNIEENIWKNSGFTFPRPAKADGNFSDNVLMINNQNVTYQGYTSASTNLAADGYALISVETYVRDLNANGYAYIKIKNSNNTVLANIKISNTNNQWQIYKIYLHNYYLAQDLTAELSLGEEAQTAYGIAFFDNCTIDTSITEDVFNEITASDKIIKIDLETNSLMSADENGNPTLWTANNISQTNTNDISSGIMDVRDYEDYFVANPTAPSSDNNTVMYIFANTPSYYYYSSDLSYKFTSGTYYKISVWVRTVGIQEDVEGEYDDNGVPVVHGASIEIEGIDKSFTGINTGKDLTSTNLVDQFNDVNNVWTEYIMYINTTSDVDGVIKLGLGNTTMYTSGYAFFANLTVTSLEEDAYKSQTATLDENNLPNNILMATNVPEDEEDAGNVYNNMDWFAIPTVIIAIAVIFAVVGFFVKKFYRAMPRKTDKINNNYDRLQTLLKDVDRRERKTAINHKIKLLHEELAQSKQFLQQESEELARQTEAYNTAKEIAQDNPTVELELPDVKQIQKSIEIQQDKIEQIELDIKILEDERDRINQQSKKDIAMRDKQQKIQNKNLKDRK